MEKRNFSELGLSPEILRAVESLGYEDTTAIQATCIPLLMEGRDVIGQSQTGTGKTAAFGIPTIEHIDVKQRRVQTLILCPTRELAMQACDEFRKFARFKHGVRCEAVYGGAPMEPQIRALRAGAHIVVGTPGRIMDHMRRKTLKIDELKTVILDEADEMLNMGFIDDIETILKDIPAEHQTVLFSATMPPEILRIAKRYQTNPEIIKVAKQQLTVDGIQQVYYEVASGGKAPALFNLIDLYNPQRAIIFCNTKRQVDELTQQLVGRGYRADGLHGDMKQSLRTRVMTSFKQGKTRLLVATDVAARGIDVDDIETVYNYDIPQDEEFYVHRIGRTGRAGKTGLAVTLVGSRREVYQLRDIQRYTKCKIMHKAIPTAAAVKAHRVESFVTTVCEALESAPRDEYIKIIEDILRDGEHTERELSAALLGMILGTEEPAKEERVKKSSSEMSRIKIYAGRNKHVSPGDIVGAIAALSGVRGTEIGAI
ncbi:MAG: DEAD/DEAH box helicase, partial [Clostridia bacterium]